MQTAERICFAQIFCRTSTFYCSASERDVLRGPENSK